MPDTFAPLFSHALLDVLIITLIKKGVITDDDYCKTLAAHIELIKQKDPTTQGDNFENLILALEGTLTGYEERAENAKASQQE